MTRTTQSKFTDLLRERIEAQKLELIEDLSYANTGVWRAEAAGAFTGGRRLRFSFDSGRSLKLDGFLPTDSSTAAFKLYASDNAGTGRGSFAEQLTAALDQATAFLLGAPVVEGKVDVLEGLLRREEALVREGRSAR